MKAPPGLEGELGLDIAANVDTVDLAKRVERLELLLFLTPEPDIKRLTKSIKYIIKLSYMTAMVGYFEDQDKKIYNAINKARNPAGEKGNLISAAEKKEIFDAFHALENKILKIKTTIEKN